MIWVGHHARQRHEVARGRAGRRASSAIFPITFIASTFVPTSTLPEPLKTFAEWNPVSSLAGSLRDLFGNPGGVALPGDPWPLQHSVAYTVLLDRRDRV